MGAIKKTQANDGILAGQQQIKKPSEKRGSSQVGFCNPQITKENNTKTARIATGAGAAVLALLGVAMKDGLKDGFNRIGNISNGISNIISVPFSLLFPFFTLNNEFLQRNNKASSKDDLLNRMVYTAASLGFAPNTWGDPLKMGTRSTPHMIATILNLPHILFSFFSYTGGRAMSFLTSLKKRKDPNNYRLEQEFESLYRLGNLGSAQASVIPMSGQFILGWETITDLCKGNFGSAFERFKKEPISVGLGTLFNSWAWPFEYVAKYLDTTIRTAEGVETFQNAFKNPNNLLVRSLKKLRDSWHRSSQENSALGKFLKYGRHLSKIEALLIPPIGMVSVVTPVLNRFMRGEFFNKEAQEIGGTIGLLDKVFNVGGFFSHIYYTGVYALSVRLPQTITTGTFYISHGLNWLRGKKAGQEGYIEPLTIREKIFGKKSGFVKSVSDFAEKNLDITELQLHPDKPELINDVVINRKTKQVWIKGKDCSSSFRDNFDLIETFISNAKKKETYTDKSGNELVKVAGSGKSKHIREFHKVIADEVCYTPLREKYYAQMAEERNKVKPSNEAWKKALKDKYQKLILDEVETTMEKYLRESVLLEEGQINDFIRGEYKHEFEAIKKHIEGFIADETRDSEPEIKPETSKKAQSKVKPKSSLGELLTNWGELKKVLKLKIFHASNTVLPLWIRGFVNVVDYGKENDPMWLRNLKATETGIREGDVKQACDREFMPVVGFAFQSMGKGLAMLHHLAHGRLPNLTAAEE